MATMRAEEFDERAFFAAIAQSQARALLIGRRALIALGIPVGTFDYDFWIHIDDALLFNQALHPLGFEPSRTPEEARATGRYVLEDESQRIDVLVARVVPTVTGERIAFDDIWPRRELLPSAQGATIAIPALDDLISTKKFGSRSKDLDDVLFLEALKRKSK